jgi:hypothetical protein
VDREAGQAAVLGPEVGLAPAAAIRARAAP